MTIDTVTTYMSHEDVQPIARTAQSASEQITSSKCVEAKAEKF